MDYKMLIKNEYFKMAVTDILYDDMEEGNVDFLKMAYEQLGIDMERIMEVKEKYPKIASKATYVVYEDIINIIMEEICQKKNEELYQGLIDFYLERFPDTKERFEDCGNDARKWHSLCLDYLDNKSLSGMRRFNFMFLYIITYGARETIKDFLKMQRRTMELCEGVGFPFYEKKNRLLDCREQIEKIYHVHNLEKSTMFLLFVEKCKNALADFLEIPRDDFKDNYDKILYQHMVQCEIELENMNASAISEKGIIDKICKKYHVNQPALDSSKIPKYLRMIRNIFSQVCMELIYAYISETEVTGHSESLEAICTCGELRSPKFLVTEIKERFWIECYVMSQKEIYDEYYKVFSFDKDGIDKEKICKENNYLKDELCQCKKALQQYADADVERRKQKEQETRKENKRYNAIISSMEKQLEEQKKAMEKQSKAMEDMGAYVTLLESASNVMPRAEDVDISKIYKHNILFVGGKQETVTRLKAVFSTASFAANEIMQPHQKTDLIILMPGHMNHSLCYQYISLAREKGIKVICCNGTDVETITKQVACNL